MPTGYCIQALAIRIQSDERCAYGGEPCRGEVEAWTHLVPSEEHHRNEGGLHEEGEDSLDGQRRSEDVADKPGIIAPVRAELEFQDKTGGHTDGEN